MINWNPLKVENSPSTLTTEIYPETPPICFRLP